MHVLVIGGGMAGLKIAKALNALLITDEKDFVFLPLLPDAINHSTSGFRIDIKSVHERTVFGKASKIDTKTREVTVDETSYRYDYLVICTGAQAATPVPGIKTYAKTFYTLDDAKEIKKSLPAKEIIVVGGGPTGVEVAAELATHGHVTLIHNANSLVQPFSQHCQAYALRQLVDLGVTVKLGETVERITSKAVIGSQDYPYDLCVWTAGVKADPIDGVPKERGILVDKYLRVKGHDTIFAAGDCAQTGAPLTAQAALQEADVVIHNIKSQMKGRKLKEYKYNQKGLMLQIGDKAHVQGMGLRFTGKFAGWARRRYYDMILRQYS